MHLASGLRRGRPFADTLHSRSVEAIDLAPSLIAILLEHKGPDAKAVRLEIGLAGDSSADVADDAPEIGLELAQRLAGALELMGMGIAVMSDQKLLCPPA